MSILSNVATDEITHNEVDSLGGNGPIPSGLYLFKITLAYLEQAASGAIAVCLNLCSESEEIEHKLWIQSGQKRGCKNYYEDKKTGAKKYLPGYNAANNLALLTVGKELKNLVEEEKVLNLYSREAGKKIPTKAPVLTELIGQDILAGVIRDKRNAQVQASDGQWEDDPSGKTKEDNEIDKFFRAQDRLTVAEIKNELKTGEFATVWEQKWSNKDRNKVRPIKASEKTSAGFSASAKPTESLFTPAQS